MSCEPPFDYYGSDSAPHAAETIGELAALRAEVAGLRAELAILRDMHYDELKKNVWVKLGEMQTGIDGCYSNACRHEKFCKELDSYDRELDGRIRTIEHKLNLI